MTVRGYDPDKPVKAPEPRFIGVEGATEKPVLYADDRTLDKVYLSLYEQGIAFEDAVLFINTVHNLGMVIRETKWENT